jgi:N-acetylmuramoyl-L-alanine amidase
MPSVVRVYTPNKSDRPPGASITAVVLHADAGRTDKGTVAWIGKAESKVSYHYLVGRDGTVYQFVDDYKKAWHAGLSTFDGIPFCNDYSIGVSFANDQRTEAFTPAQLAAGVKLVGDLCRKYAIPLHRITTHAIVSPGRKHDPGPRFPIKDFLLGVAERMDDGD